MTRRHMTPKVIPLEHRPKSEWLYGVPWAILAGIIVGGAVLHDIWGDQLPAAPLAAVGVLLGTQVLTWLTWQHASGRDRITRAQAAATVALAGLALLRSLAAGVDTGWVSTQVLIGGFVAVSWNIRSMRVVRGDGRDHHEQQSVGELIGLHAGTRVGRAKVAGPRAEVAVRTAGGETADDVAKAGKAVGGLLHLPPNAVRTVPDPDDSSRATWVMMTEDVLRHRIPWPGPSRPGGSITEPLRTGLYEDGQPEQWWLTGNWSPDRPRHVEPRNAVHLLVMGMSGAGKSEWAKAAAGEILTRRDVALIWVDSRKARQTAAPIEAGLELLVDTAAGAKQLLAGLTRVVAYRADLFGRAGWREWWPGCGLPYVVVWIEEAAAVVAESDVITDLSESLRSVGVSLVVSLQRAAGDRIPTSARANLGAAACFGVNAKGGYADASFALSEDTIAAGAHPETWGAGRPGYHYLEAPGVPADRWSMPARGYDTDDDQLRAAVAQWAHVRSPLDDGTAACLALPQTTIREEPMDDDDDGYRIPPQPEPELAARVNPREPIPPWDGDNIPLGPPDDGQPPLSREQKEAVFEQILLGFAERQQIEVRMGELVDAWQTRTGQPPSKGRPRIHEMLGRRIEQGQIERAEGGRGVYRLHMLVAPNGHRP